MFQPFALSGRCVDARAIASVGQDPLRFEGQTQVRLVCVL